MRLGRQLTDFHELLLDKSAELVGNLDMATCDHDVHEGPPVSRRMRPCSVRPLRGSTRAAGRNPPQGAAHGPHARPTGPGLTACAGVVSRMRSPDPQNPSGTPPRALVASPESSPRGHRRVADRAPSLAPEEAPTRAD